MAMVEGIRASDADRQQVVELLKEHSAQGRLNLDELEDRTGAAYAAKTRRQLQQLTRDLPGVVVFQRDPLEPLAGGQRAPAGASSWQVVVACCCGLLCRRRP
jgi:Domain of unknown function (DUF1707)